MMLFMPSNIVLVRPQIPVVQDLRQVLLQRFCEPLHLVDTAAHQPAAKPTAPRVNRHVNGKLLKHGLKHQSKARPAPCPGHVNHGDLAFTVLDPRYAGVDIRLVLPKIEMAPGLLDGIVRGQELSGDVPRKTEQASASEIELDVQLLGNLGRGIVGGLEFDRGNMPRLRKRKSDSEELGGIHDFST